MKLKPYPYRSVVKALGKLGFRVVRQRGSHLILKGLFKEKKRTVVIPKHKEIAVGTLRGILFQAGLTVKEFQELIKNV